MEALMASFKISFFRIISLEWIVWSLDKNEEKKPEV